MSANGAVKSSPAERSSSETADPKRPRGRPRDPDRHLAILDATRELILEGGYNRISFDAVAKRAGVSRMTVHKWWGHRVELVQEALFPDYSDMPAPDGGSFEEDLRLLVAEMVDQLTRPELVLGLPPLRAELNANPELLRATGALYGAPAAARWTTVFERAAARGEVSPRANAAAALHVVLGSIEAFSQVRPPVISRSQLTPYLVAVLLGGAAGGAAIGATGSGSR